jgi:hypothetical protein
MNSFISPFKGWLAAGFALLAIEAAIQLVAPHSLFDRTNFLQFSFGHDETLQRVFVFDKVKAFADSRPTILQAGDSSGFYGIEPAVVMRHLPPGVTYLNMSCCANLGYRGYYNILEFMAERNPTIKYMVLHVTPWTMPSPELWDSDGAALWGTPDLKVFGGAFYEEFQSIWRAFHLPSLAFRRQVTDRTYSLNGTFNQLDRPLTSSPAYSEFSDVFAQARGWTPETDKNAPVTTGDCIVAAPEFFSLRSISHKSSVEEVFGAFAAMARRHHAILVIAFQPVSCVRGSREENNKAQKFVDEFKQKNPDVEIPFPLFETWPSNLFSANPHILRGHTDLVGDRLGAAMAEIMKRHGS